MLITGLTTTARRALLTGAALLATATGGLAFTAAQADAARGIQNAQSFRCGQARVSVAPPRVWASPGRPEAVGWGVGLERHNGRRWVAYSNTTVYSTFNSFGQSLTSWSGGLYHANHLNVPVRHRGHYRVVSVVMAQFGGRDVRYVANGASCYVP